MGPGGGEFTNRLSGARGAVIIIGAVVTGGVAKRYKVDGSWRGYERY